MEFGKTSRMKSNIAFSALILCFLHCQQALIAELALSTLGSFEDHVIDLIKSPVDGVLNCDRYSLSVSVFLMRHTLSDSPVDGPQKVQESFSSRLGVSSSGMANP